MKTITPFNPHNIIVKYNTGRYQGRIQTSLSFQEEYVDALRAALKAVREGFKEVEVIQYREVIHTHSQLLEALENINKYSTDDEVIEHVHHASRSYEHRSLMHLLQSVPHSRPVVWAAI